MPGGAADDPEPQGIVSALPKKLGQDLALEDVERLGVAEEARHADENVGVEGVDLLGVSAEEGGVVTQGRLLAEQQSPRDAPPHGRGLVEREVHA